MSLASFLLMTQPDHAVQGKATMHIRYGFDIELQFSQPTTLITVLDVHPSRRGDIVREQDLSALSSHPTLAHIDPFGNLCRRILVEDGFLRLRCDGLIGEDGEDDKATARARVEPIMALPRETLIYLQPSRYCETDLLSELAGQHFGKIADGGRKVQAIIDFVQAHLSLDDEPGGATRSAFHAFEQKAGTSGDHAHLAVALCRCLGIPARYCTGYPGAASDAAAKAFGVWFQAFIGGQWRSFDPLHPQPPSGRILIGWGRDAADVAMIRGFGQYDLVKFEVMTARIPEEPAAGEFTAALQPVASPEKR